MAEAVRWVCSKCGREIVAWSDGNPYYIDETGRKQNAYHPHHERLARCIGNDSPHLCLACGKKFNVDLRAPTAECPKCEAADIVHTHQLGGRRCPYCKAGVFARDPDYHCVS
jgi:DNA-directed RNA polymerase subunit RPC12/RpoP